MTSSTQISYHPSLSGRSVARWPDSVAIAQGAGFSAMDLALPDIAAEAPAAVRQTLEASGLRPGGVPLPVEFRRDEKTFQDDLADLPMLARVAAEVGVHAMYRSLPASDIRPRDELGPILRHRLAVCASILREQGIGLALEVLGPLHRRREAPYEFIWRLPDCASFAQTCGPGVGVLVDSWHWHHSGGTAEDIVDLSGHILHVHVADAPQLPAAEIRDDERVLPGEGIVDLASFFGALAVAGYDGIISPEIPGTWCESTAPADCARRAHKAVDRLLQTLS
jgi:sugar phosphate isomerase/epimerase